MLFLFLIVQSEIFSDCVTDHFKAKTNEHSVLRRQLLRYKQKRVLIYRVSYNRCNPLL